MQNNAKLDVYKNNNNNNNSNNNCNNTTNNNNNNVLNIEAHTHTYIHVHSHIHIQLHLHIYVWGRLIPVVILGKALDVSYLNKVRMRHGLLTQKMVTQRWLCASV